MLNRTIVAKAVARRLGLPDARGREAVDIVLDMITQELASGNDAALMGFGTFSVVHRAAREGRNPRTGEKIAVAASIAVTFKAHKALKGALNPAPVRKVGPDRNAPMRERKRA